MYRQVLSLRSEYLLYALHFVSVAAHFSMASVYFKANQCAQWLHNTIQVFFACMQPVLESSYTTKLLCVILALPSKSFSRN